LKNTDGKEIALSLFYKDSKLSHLEGGSNEERRPCGQKKEKIYYC